MISVSLSYLQARIDQVEHEIKDIQQKKEDEQNEIEGTASGSDEGDDDNYDHSYEEKVRRSPTVNDW